jgi:uncharacterized protein (TIGR00725 family)
MKILIIGSCRNNDQEQKIEHQKLAEQLGKEIAKRNYEIITGAVEGLQKYIVSAYKKAGGKKWTTYLAIDEYKNKKSKKNKTPKPDKKIKTNYNYAIRDAYYIEKCDAVIALSGRALTLSEIIQAIKNYNKKVFQLDIGQNIKIIKQIPELQNNLIITVDINEGLNFLE